MKTNKLFQTKKEETNVEQVISIDWDQDQYTTENGKKYSITPGKSKKASLLNFLRNKENK